MSAPGDGRGIRFRHPFVLPAVPVTSGQRVNDHVIRDCEPVLDRDGEPLVYRRRDTDSAVPDAGG